MESAIDIQTRHTHELTKKIINLLAETEYYLGSDLNMIVDVNIEALCLALAYVINIYFPDSEKESMVKRIPDELRDRMNRFK
jgi:hypothetical protein